VNSYVQPPIVALNFSLEYPEKSNVPAGTVVVVVEVVDGALFVDLDVSLTELVERLGL